MSHQFKPGDLALIVKEDHPDNMGRVVELLFLVGAGDIYQRPDGEKARNAAGIAIWVVSAVGLLHRRRPNDWYVAGWTQKAPYNLMPLRGDFAPEQSKSREVAA